MITRPAPDTPGFCGASLSIPRTDPGRPRAVVEVSWLVPEARIAGVACARSTEPTLHRSALAERAATRARSSLLDAWMATSNEPVPDRLRAAITAADEGVRAEVRFEKQRPPPAFEASVEIAVIASSGDAVWIAHAGGCRVYQAQRGVWARLTCDHSLAEEFPQLAGAPEARRTLTRSLGLGRFAGADITRHDASTPWLLCTPDLAATLEANPHLPALSSPDEALSVLEQASRGAAEALWFTAVIVA